MTHLEAAKYQSEIYKAFLDFMQAHRGESNVRKRFYAIAQDRWPFYRVSSIQKIVYACGDTASVSRRKTHKPSRFEWSSSWNLYIDHEDGRGYYGERPRSYLDKLIVENVDIDADVWQCTGKRGISVKKLRRATMRRIKKAA